MSAATDALTRARVLLEQRQHQTESAAKARDQAIRQCRSEGRSLRAIARIAGVSHSRVRQICGEAP